MARRGRPTTSTSSTVGNANASADGGLRAQPGLNPFNTGVDILAREWSASSITPSLDPGAITATPSRRPAAPSRQTDAARAGALLRATAASRSAATTPAGTAAAGRDHPSPDPSRVPGSCHSLVIPRRSAVSFSTSNRSCGRPARSFKRSKSSNPMKVADTPGATSILTAH